jgi:hypothetical protein
VDAFDFICQNRQGDYLRGECTASGKEDLSKKLARARLFLVWWVTKALSESDPPAPAVIDEMWMRPINTREVMQLMSSGKTAAQRHEFARPLEFRRVRMAAQQVKWVNYCFGAAVWLGFAFLGYWIAKPNPHSAYNDIPPDFIARLSPLRAGMHRADVERVLSRAPGPDNPTMETEYAGPAGWSAVVVYDNAGGPWNERNMIVIPPGIRSAKKTP